MNPELNVVLASGYSEQDVTRRFEGKGLSAFIERPYTLKTLRATPQQVFESGAARPDGGGVGERK